MRKSYLMSIIALAALSMTSCSNDEVLQAVPQEQVIEFGTYLGRDVGTRGIVLDNDNLTDFGVFASYTGQYQWTLQNTFNFMFNQKVEKSEGVWTYTPLKYWPTTNNDKISFWAYAPYAGSNAISVVSTNQSTGIPQIKYTLTADNLDKAEDFTADVLIDETKAGDGNSIDSGDRTVSFTLQHELSRIAFQAKLDRDAFGDADANKTQVNITKIEFGGTGFATEATYSFAITDNTRGNWLLNTHGTSSLDITKLLNISTESLGGYTTAGVRIKDKNLVTLFKQTGEGSNAEASYLFHIPTNGTSGTSAAGDVTLTISYDIVTVDNKLSEGYSVTPAVKRFNLPKESLKQGSAYNYILTFGLNEIKLSASVADWDENTVYNDVDWTITDVK